MLSSRKGDLLLRRIKEGGEKGAISRIEDGAAEREGHADKSRGRSESCVLGGEATA